MIIGDMNICNKKYPKNSLKTFLEDKNFTQIITSPTHLDGGFIDHAYIINKGHFLESPEVELSPKYYSDHDALCISWKRN